MPAHTTEPRDSPLIHLHLPPSSIYLLIQALTTASSNYQEYAARTKSPGHASAAQSKAASVDQLREEITSILRQAEESAIERFILDPGDH